MRKLNSIKNFLTSTVPFVILIFLGFWKVNVWQNSLDADVYALNQLFFQLFAYLSLAEAGIGALVLKEYYRLFVERNNDEICIYYTLSKKMLRNVCYVIMAIGIVLSFFLGYFANDNQLSVHYMQKVFLLFLAKSLVEYFMFSPRFVLQADQKLYKVNLQMNFYKILEAVLETILIMVGISYSSVLIMSILLRIIMNLHTNKIVFKEYPWLHKVKDTKNIKIRGMQHVFIYKVVTAVHDNIDVLLISTFVNPIAVIIYSNYKYITKYLSDMIYQVGSSISSSMGNLLNAEKNEQGYHTYEMISTVFYFIGAFLTICLMFCINPFIELWVGKGKLYDMFTLSCAMFLFFHTVARRAQYIVVDVFALYKDIQIASIVEAIVNLTFSLLLVKPFGITGVLIATVMATLFTSFWYFPKLVYKKIFYKSMWNDLRKYLLAAVLTGGILVVSFRFYPAITSEGYVTWFLQSALYACIVFCILFVLFYAMFQSFRRFLQQSLEFIIRLKKGKTEK